jgi:D-psicose/D-tagatose/L-ribulose 3-epimerase
MGDDSMKLGMNLLLYTTQPTEAIFGVCDKLLKFGFDSLEWPLLGDNPEMEKRIGKYNADRKLDATAVTVFPPGANPLSADSAERAAAEALIAHRIEQCATIGAKLLVGPIVQTLGQFSGTAPTGDERKRCVDMLRKAGDVAKKHEITLAVEFLNRFEIYFVNTAADAAKLCDEVNHPHVKMMYDSFHAHIEEKCQHDAIVGAARHIVHFHVSENDRGVPGSGQVRWADYFRAIKEIEFDGRLTIESFGDALPDLAAAAKIWRPLFAHSDDVPFQGISFIKKMLAA